MSELLKLFALTADQARAMAAESVAGAPIEVEGVTLIPISKLSCGFAGGGSDRARAPAKGADGLLGGASVKVTRTPVSFLAVCNGQVQLLHADEEAVKKNALVSALLPLVSQLKEKFAKPKADDMPTPQEVE